MENPTTHCPNCFSATATLSRHTFADQYEALTLFRSLQLDGLQPVLCRPDDAKFWVCHERPSA